MRTAARTLPLVVLSVVALTLGGCATTDTAGGSPSASASSPAAPSPSASTPAPTPSSPPEETVDPHPPFEELVISTAGLGPLTIGVPPETNPGAAMIEWVPNACGEWDPENPGRWVSTYALPDGSQPLGVSVSDKGVGWIDVLMAGPRTAEGVGIGTDLATLQATYPNLVAGTPGPVSNVWWLKDDKGILSFETQGDKDGLQPAGTAEKVVHMSVLTSTADPDFARANTDQVAGGCF
ncbi:hypothetical protein ACFP63_15895 [Oerskovia jenensis]|uniref:Lipoprotein LpqN n=1 Tax=Oerskovia jenensis TaxID=162169 RepID=A0ABS2LEN5_9CELL|nr:hypothetical protein [Oerskovia jenensis]MBM7478609.1 hypothetical protein [Oerskovia jenensis]